MIRKKNKFWTFCFSLIPGAGEMYMGFMKMGVSLMGLFMAVGALAVMLGMVEIIMIDVVVWFYSFFHTHNLRALDDEEFYALEDAFLFQLSGFEGVSGDFVKKYQKGLGIILIVFGAVYLWKSIISGLYWVLPDFLRDFIERLDYNIFKILFAVLVIVMGVKMIQGKKRELQAEEQKLPEEGEE